MPCSTCTTDGVFTSAVLAMVPKSSPDTAPPGRPAPRMTATAPPQTTNDRRLQITDLRAGDTATVRRVFDGLSGRSRYLRFHAGRATLPIGMQRGLADTRPDQHVAHVAVLAGGAVGVGCWVPVDSDRRGAGLAVGGSDAPPPTRR